jgi:hypothetical protein
VNFCTIRKGRYINDQTVELTLEICPCNPSISNRTFDECLHEARVNFPELGIPEDLQEGYYKFLSQHKEWEFED